MEAVILLTLIAFCATAQLPSRTYLPPNLGSQGTSEDAFVALSHPSSSIFGGHGVTRRPQREFEKNAVVLKQDQEMSENGDFHYSYKTSNDIQAFSSGNTAVSQGGFSYTGDDGKTYTVTYTAGEGGFRPHGAHLPQLPENVDKIIRDSLEQNAKDEAAGIFDDGQYHPQHHGSGAIDIRKGLSSTYFGSTGYSSVKQGTLNSKTGYQY